MGWLVIKPDPREIEVPPEKPLLQVLRELGVRVPYNCRRGLCGQDLIRIWEGWEHLNPVLEHEEGTLELLQAKGQPMRMACCARIVGAGKVVIEIL